LRRSLSDLFSGIVFALFVTFLHLANEPKAFPRERADQDSLLRMMAGIKAA